MKVGIIGFIIFLLNSSFINSPSTLHIEVTNLRSSKGFVLVSLYNNAKDFPQNAAKAVGKMKVAIEGGKAIAVFNDIAPGKYAAAILHDENQNLKMDFNVVGIPKEGYGFSNDAKGLFGPPAFGKAAFSVEGEKRIVVRVGYVL
jgi:uncharacterized protein (DUF2141 family)